VLVALGEPFVLIGGGVDPQLVNGQPRAILRDRDGKVLNSWALDILDGQITTIRVVLNPEKLGHIGPVTDAYAVFAEANDARRLVGQRAIPTDPT
jgi:RNA polymerase sigma-70 factor (ECF subfamily)